MDDVVRMLNEHSVRYLLIGGQAARLEGVPRFTLDLDLYIPPRDERNLATINRVFEEDFDLPVLPLGPKGENCIQTYQTRWGIIQFHLGGPGLPPFDEAAARAVEHEISEGTRVRCLSGRDLLASKEAVNRPQDQLDIDFLRMKRDAGLI